jgi:hypothetical protein
VVTAQKSQVSAADKDRVQIYPVLTARRCYEILRSWYSSYNAGSSAFAETHSDPPQVTIGIIFFVQKLRLPERGCNPFSRVAQVEGRVLFPAPLLCVLIGSFVESTPGWKFPEVRVLGR